MVNIRQDLVDSSKYNIKCPYEMTPEFIVVHNTANDASAKNEISYMKSNNNKVSFHYAVDDVEIVQGITEDRNAWHAGDGGNGQGNRKGIAIEICYSKSGGEKFDKAEKNAAEFIASKLYPYFPTEESLYRYIDRKMDTRYRSDITRRIRCLRRAALHELSYFCTFTYDSKKMNEEEFERKLLNTLSHFASRKGWKYMGTWERGKDTDRLHFHAIMHIPEGAMSGELVKKREYDVKKKRMVEWIENTFFEKKYGRNTFEFVDGTALTVNTAIEYIVKYLEKDGGRIICSKGLHTFLETDIDNKDIVCRLREGEDKKYILFDDFKVYKDGKELGTISPGVLACAKTVE